MKPEKNDSENEYPNEAFFIRKFEKDSKTTGRQMRIGTVACRKTGLFGCLWYKVEILWMGITYLKSAALLFLTYVNIDMTWGFQISYYSLS